MLCAHVSVCAPDGSRSPRIWHSFQTDVQGAKTPGTPSEMKSQSEVVRLSYGHESSENCVIMEEFL